MPVHGSAWWVVCSALVFGCAPLPGDATQPDDATGTNATALVTTERRRGSTVLVRIDESGSRIRQLTPTEPGVGDRQPAISPDGRWVLFSSNRHRESPEATSVWMVSQSGDDQLIRLTTGSSIDRDPVWDPSGESIIFSSSRGGSFELYRLTLVADESGVLGPGTITAVTNSPDHSLAPAVSPDGRWIAFMAVARAGESTLWLVPATGGAPRQLSRGPADVTPAFSRSGRWVYFAGRVPGREDSDIYRIDRTGNRRQLVISEPMSDQSGPRLSDDGRWLFATSVYRSAGSGKPVLSSVVASDLAAEKRSWRALHDSAYVESRVGIAVHGRVSAASLAANAEYGPALRRAIEKALGDAAAR